MTMRPNRHRQRPPVDLHKMRAIQDVVERKLAERDAQQRQPEKGTTRLADVVPRFTHKPAERVPLERPLNTAHSPSPRQS